MQVEGRRDVLGIVDLDDLAIQQPGVIDAGCAGLHVLIEVTQPGRLDLGPFGGVFLDRPFQVPSDGCHI